MGRIVACKKVLYCNEAGMVVLGITVKAVGDGHKWFDNIAENIEKANKLG